jgi:hypothetical protein
MNLKHIAAALLVAGVTTLTLAAAPAHAADTAVTCVAPTATFNTGQDGSSPRFTIDCTGGSSAGVITYFAFKSGGGTVASEVALLEHILSGFVLAKGTGATINISSDLSNITGNAWGCGSANCRIIDYLTGY